jgi:hypothetical protein
MSFIQRQAVSKIFAPTTTSACDKQYGGKPCCEDNRYGRKESARTGYGICPSTSYRTETPSATPTFVSTPQALRNTTSWTSIYEVTFWKTLNLFIFY